MAYDDDDDDGPGFLTTAVLLALGAGGVWLLWRTLSPSAAAATGAPSGTTGLTLPSVLSNLVNAASPRGVRNNNPGNIKYNAANAWEGQTGQDADGFAIFSDQVYGLRAMFMILQSYAGEISPFTIANIAARWTSGDPSTSQANWIATTSAISGFDQNATLDPSNDGAMLSLVNGIIAAENGQTYLALYAGQLAQAQQLAA